MHIPSAFIKKLNTSSPHRLRGPSGDGECWDVELEKSNQLFFHRGWEKFVQHHPVEVGDFLIFSYDAVDEEEEIFIPFQSENPFVYRTLGTNSLYEVYVPKEVIRKEGYRVGMTLEIKEVFGIFWKVTFGGSPEAGRMLIRSGLPNICRANQASPGDTVIFEFVKPGVVQLHVVKAGAHKQPRIIR
ncbi:hypothetical protein ACLB2K_014435 [Fragaria x ananassa]